MAQAQKDFDPTKGVDRFEGRSRRGASALRGHPDSDLHLKICFISNAYTKMSKMWMSEIQTCLKSELLFDRFSDTQSV